jgi:hypothetical protein
VKKTKLQWEEHVGLLGPVIKAEVNDTIEIVFRNLASRPYSVFPQGVAVSKDQEGAVYHQTADSE